MTRAEYEACQASDEQGFRRAIEALTLKGLETGLAKLDYRALVGDEWRRGNLDDVIDRQVDEAIGQVRDEFELAAAVVVARLARARAGACDHRSRACLPLGRHQEGHRAGWPPASARRSASASSWP